MKRLDRASVPGLFLAAGVPFRLEKDLQHPYLAALDRQHPRDLFDVRDLLANEGITDDLREAFIIYLISHDRPISEVVVPRRKDIEHEFTHGFEGMSADEVSLDELLEARETLIAEIAGKMPQAHKDFLIGFNRGEPDWRLLGVPGATELPAVRWKQINLDKLPAEHWAKLVAQLEEVLRNA
ncbi:MULTISPECIES: nucleotidyl transferase AbiEii/AbiGii toxin family protein [Bradyrhizobium]|uniref:nucleotidyl transferase AbiEii/AbiGii toxin family protein n=1 Tax=Bradyrhizobium TaxID=374 RepID=UPI0030CD8801